MKDYIIRNEVTRNLLFNITMIEAYGFIDIFSNKSHMNELSNIVDELMNENGEVDNLSKEETEIVRNTLGVYIGKSSSINDIAKKLNLTVEEVSLKEREAYIKLNLRVIRGCANLEEELRNGSIKLNEYLKRPIICSGLDRRVINSIYFKTYNKHFAIGYGIDSIGDILHNDVLIYKQSLSEEEFNELLNFFHSLGLHFYNEKTLTEASNKKVLKNTFIKVVK